MNSDSETHIKNDEHSVEEKREPKELEDKVNWKQYSTGTHIKYDQHSDEEKREPKEHEDKVNWKQYVPGEKPTPSYVIYSFLAVVVVLCGAFWTINYGNPIRRKVTYINDLKQIFPNQPNETFEYFEAVIDDILFTKVIHPAVFLFLYDSNESKVNNLVQHLANYATQKLETNTAYIDVHESEFHAHEALKDYGYIIDKYRKDLLVKKVMLVKDLQNIPAYVAQVFHSFCDEFSPLVERVVYIFTLKVDSMIGKEEKIAESNLKKLWRNLDNDILMPLITRITSTVLKVLN